MGGGEEDTAETRNDAVDRTTTDLLNRLRTQVGEGTAVFDQPLYTGMSSTTQGGLNDLVSASRQGEGGLQDAYTWSRRVMNSGGLNNAQQQNINTVGNVGNQYGQIAGSLANPSAAQTGFARIANGAQNPSAAQTGYTSIANGARNPSAAQTGFTSIANSAANPSAAQTGYTSLYRGAGAPSLTESTLMNVARGGAMGMNDPGYSRLRSNVANDTMRDINTAFNASGRFGGGANVESASEGIGNALAGLDYQNYQSDIARQERALGAIEGQRQESFQNQMGALGASDQARLAQAGLRMNALSASDQARLAQTGLQMNALGAADQARLAQTGLQMNALSASDQARLAQLSGRMGALGAQQGAAGSAFGMNQTGADNAARAASMAPTLYNATLQPAMSRVTAGQMFDADAMARRQSENDLFRRQNDAGWQTLERASSILNGNAGSGGAEEEAPWWQSALGGALGIGSLFL